MPSGNPKIAQAGENTRWKPGQTGNPVGKPKGAIHINTHIQNLLAQPDFEANLLDPKKGMIEYKGTPLEAVLRVVLHKAVNGDAKMIDLLMKYGWSQKNETEHSGEQQLTIVTRKHDDNFND